MLKDLKDVLSVDVCCWTKLTERLEMGWIDTDDRLKLKLSLRDPAVMDGELFIFAFWFPGYRVRAPQAHGTQGRVSLAC